MSDFFDEADISKKKSVRNKKPAKPAPPIKKTIPKTVSDKEMEAAIQAFKNEGMI